MKTRGYTGVNMKLTDEEKYYAWHFYVAVVEDRAAFSIPKKCDTDLES